MFAYYFQYFRPIFVHFTSGMYLVCIPFAKRYLLFDIKVNQLYNENKVTYY